MTGEEMVKEFLCPGCVCGMDTTCGRYKLGEGSYSAAGYFNCAGHVLGTMIMGIGNIALGMPRGFQRPPHIRGENNTTQHVSLMEIYLAPKGTPLPDMNKFNVPVWAMEKDGFLFLHIVSPRINYMRTFVLEGRTFAELPPGVVNVAEFYEEMD
jgi:hypothetical protein